MISGGARLAGVMGWPVAHSRSPALHGHWLAAHGVDGAYLPLAVRPDDLAASLALLPRIGFAGFNVTLPHKETAARLVTRLDRDAARIGAVNTVVVGAEGHLEGRNTDAFGLMAHLLATIPDWRPGPTALLGAGGAARAALVGLADAGVSDIRVVNRDPARRHALCAALGGRPFPWSAVAPALDGARLLVNATSLGMTGQPPLALDLDPLAPGAIVYDMVYNPLETALLARARQAGFRIVDGLGMLLHQARPGFAAWFGVEPDVTPALRAATLGVGG